MEVMTTLERQIQRNRRLLDSDPNNVDLMLTYALDCLRRDLRFEALVTFQKAIQQKDTADAHLALAQIFYLQSLYRESYEELRRVFKLDSINIGAHVLLHLLKDKEDIPDDLAPRLAFVPSRAALGDEMINVRNERDLYKREVQEYEAIAANGVNDPEPIVLYCLREAQKRVDRINVNLEIMSGWELLAIDMPGFLPEEKSGSVKAIEVKAIEADTTVSIDKVAAGQSAGSSVETESEAVVEAEENHSKKSKKSKRRRGKERHAVAATEAEFAAETVESAPEIESKEGTAEAEESVEVNVAETAEVPESVSADNSEVSTALEAEEPASQIETLAAEATDIVEATSAVEEEAEVDLANSEVVEVASPDDKEPLVNNTSVAENENTEVETAATEPEHKSDECSADVTAATEVLVPDVEKAEVVEEAIPEQPSEEVLAREVLFSEFLAYMCKIKGSVRAMVLTAHGRIAAVEGDFEKAEEVAAKVANFLKSVSSDGQIRLVTFVSESKNSSVILQQINDTYYMLVDGRSVTLGVLRQRAERCKTELAGLC
ncbi:MAG: hypothetical protein ACI376_02325 [Candidatus Bruticola sp.]